MCPSEIAHSTFAFPGISEVVIPNKGVVVNGNNQVNCNIAAALCC
jgi:hypothetical protein